MIDVPTLDAEHDRAGMAMALMHPGNRLIHVVLDNARCLHARLGASLLEPFGQGFARSPSGLEV
jgi:hypothetical protein